MYDMLGKMGVEVPELLVTTLCLPKAKLGLEVENGLCITLTLCIVYLPYLGRKS